MGFRDYRVHRVLGLGFWVSSPLGCRRVYDVLPLLEGCPPQKFSGGLECPSGLKTGS